VRQARQTKAVFTRSAREAALTGAGGSKSARLIHRPYHDRIRRPCQAEWMTTINATLHSNAAAAKASRTYRTALAWLLIWDRVISRSVPVAGHWWLLSGCSAVFPKDEPGASFFSILPATSFGRDVTNRSGDSHLVQAGTALSADRTTGIVLHVCAIRPVSAAEPRGQSWFFAALFRRPTTGRPHGEQASRP